MLAPQRLLLSAFVLGIPFLQACGDDDDDDGNPIADAGRPDAGSADGGGNAACDESLSLPDGFCAQVFARDVARARHIAVTASGDVYVASKNEPGENGAKGKITALRDTDADGVADERVEFGDDGADGVLFRLGQLYVGHDDRIVRYTIAEGDLAPSDPPEVIVADLPTMGDHNYKNIDFAADGDLLVNIGSATNSCQVENRVDESPGIPDCPELAVRAGIWKFDSTTVDQTQADGTRFATGLRNGEAMRVDPNGQLWSAQNGRDQLFDNWPEYYTAADELRLPSEVLYKVDEGDDFGWPYCYYDPDLGDYALAPEYGGDGQMQGACSEIEQPLSVFPAHWAPLSILFYTGEQFPEHYRGGMFIAFHGSWADPNAIDPPGYQLGFVPFGAGAPAGEWETFIDDFAGDARPLPDMAAHRPVGLAQGPDGSLYITDDHAGTIWRVTYLGEGE